MVRKILLILLFPFSIAAQEDCFLGIGGRDDEIITAVFQLTDSQVEKLRNWGAELEFRNEIFEQRAKRLLKTHAQSSPEDLLKMSYTYRALMDSMEQNMRMLDQRMLGIFTQEQYNLYILLCNKVARSPIYATRSVNEK